MSCGSVAPVDEGTPMPGMMPMCALGAAIVVTEDTDTDTVEFTNFPARSQITVRTLESLIFGEKYIR